MSRVVGRPPRLWLPLDRLGQLPLTRIVGQSARSAAALYFSFKEANAVAFWTLEIAARVVSRAAVAADTLLWVLRTEKKKLAKPPREMVARWKRFVSASAAILLEWTCALGAGIASVLCIKSAATPTDDCNILQHVGETQSDASKPEAAEPLECAECKTRAEILKYRQKLKRERTEHL